MAAQLRKAESGDIERQNRWSISAFWDIERKWIGSWLPEEAASRIAQARGNTETAKKAVRTVVKNLEGTFVDEDESRNPNLLTQAKSGNLASEAGSLGGLWTARVFFWLCLTCEVGFFLVLFLLGLGNFFLVLQGILLATGAFFVGEGLYQLIRPNEDKTLGQQTSRRSILNGLLLLILGLAIVIFILWLRYDGEEAGSITIFTLALTFAVIVLTYLHKYLTERYENSWQRMLLAQRWYASDQHRKACSEQGMWRAEYLMQVEQQDRGAREALDPPPPPSTASEQGTEEVH